MNLPGILPLFQSLDSSEFQIVTLKYFNTLKESGYYIYIYITCFNIHNRAFCSQRV
jgi:hypothetical protein